MMGGGGRRQCTLCIDWVVCVSHESWLDMNSGVSCSRQSRRLSHQTYTIDRNHETDIKHQMMAGNYASSFSFLFSPPAPVLLCFMQYFFLTQINREWKQTEQRKHNSHASHSLSPLHTCTHTHNIGFYFFWGHCVDMQVKLVATQSNTKRNFWGKIWQMRLNKLYGWRGKKQIQLHMSPRKNNEKWDVT